MKAYAQPIKRLISELAKLPGIGEKTAARLANFILRATEDDVRKLARSKGMFTMKEDAIMKAFKGEVGFEEVDKL